MGNVFTTTSRCPPDEGVGFGRGFDCSFAGRHVEGQQLILRIARDDRPLGHPPTRTTAGSKISLDDGRIVDEDLGVCDRYMPCRTAGDSTSMTVFAICPPPRG